MTAETLLSIYDVPDLRGRTRVFQDRVDAGGVLARMLSAHGLTRAVVMAIPAGGLPVAEAIARRLGAPLDVCVASKITPLTNPEVGYGAVAFDGTFHVDWGRAGHLGVSADEVRRGLEAAYRKVERRVERLRGARAMPDLHEHPVVLVDDGVASGLTMCAAAKALRKAGAEGIVVAVPTGFEPSLKTLIRDVEAVYCANVREGGDFAVADAYASWSDVGDAEAEKILARFHGETP